jgi:hypothetical protein
MVRRNKPKIQLVPNVHTRPPLTATDAKIAQNHGYSAVVEPNPERIQAAKKMPAPSLTHLIEQKTWENEQLRQELAYQQRKNGPSMYLLEEVRLVVASLQQAISNVQAQNDELEDDANGGR